MKLISLSILLAIAGFTTISCCPAKKAATEQQNAAVGVPGPKVIIYQMRGNYSDKVPIILSENKKSVESYPDVRDVILGSSFAYPTQLHGNFWLDNRGIGKNVAFLKLTYEEYSKLEKTPTPDELLKMIIDKNPITRMYQGGLRSKYSNIADELNQKIDAGDFDGFSKIK